MAHDQRITGEYLEIRDDDFDEWVSKATIKCLLDANYEYLTVMESEAKLAGRGGDFSDPDTLCSVHDVIVNLCVYADRICKTHAELYRRCAPLGHAADYSSGLRL